MLIKKYNQRGFTLVEVAVIAPVMILIALSIVAILIALVSSTVGPNARSILIQQGQKSFDSIESDVNNSSGLLPTLPANFTDNAAGDYSSPPSGTTVLRIQTYDQIQNPNDSSGTKVIPAFKDTSPCSNTTVLDSNNIVPIVVIYFVKNNTLYRRTLTDTTTPTPTTCGTKLAKSTGCGDCTSEDIALLRADSVTKFEVTYYDSVVLDSNPNSVASASSKSAKITIESSLEAGGDTIKYTANLRAARLNN